MMPILRISVVFLASGVLMTGCLAGRHAQRQALAQKRTFVPLAGLAKPISPAACGRRQGARLSCAAAV